MSASDVWGPVGHWFAALPTYKQVLLVVATTMFVVELILRRFARGSPLYRKWTALFEGIGAFWSAIILSLVYFSCPMLCGMTTDGLVRSVRALRFEPGTDFEILSVSFDPRETAEMASEKKRTVMAQYGRKSGPGRSPTRSPRVSSTAW